MDKLNTPQKNRVLMILETARDFNNFVDCDVIQERITGLEKAKGYNKTIDAIYGLMGAMEFRKGKGQRYNLIKWYVKDIVDYSSMFTALQGKNPSAIMYFEKEAKNNKVIRLI